MVFPPLLRGKEIDVYVHWSGVEVPFSLLREAISPNTGKRNIYSPQKINRVLSD